ncbi:MAG: glutamine--fructose-6-phosphate transaminase (isomerizing) [Bacteroidales bacterium]|nr:glutamine--fructose-6-phosphate transaminase (isomerizing) [Bacteroidales bacterium]MCF8337444.1 glutamine--fructose-6-phosphate transaminase (isomerizing) [Bacteroidales bacterium]
MCGIVGYVGNKQAYPILINGLHRLEYRGYDSAGITLVNHGVKQYKQKGKVSVLEEYVSGKDISGQTGIAHTRWATHGEPTDENAHPHSSYSKGLSIVHNGIIENYSPLKKELINRGYDFQSDTDSEVLINLIEDIQNKEKVDLTEAVRVALNNVVGAYAIVVASEEYPDMLIAARKGSPLVVGIGKDDDFFLASDATPIVEHTKQVVYLEDEEIAIVKKGEDLQIKTIRNKSKTPYVQELEMNLSALEKQGYDHFMLKEIYEQPQSILDSMRGRLNPENWQVRLGGILDYEQKMVNAKRIIIIACGTSWHASLVGEYIFEELARVPVEVEYASEFRYRDPILGEEDVVIAISQSGETADTLAAIELARSKGATILGICNVVGSSIARGTHAGTYTHAGPEIGVASTKAFTAQVTVLSLMALRIAKLKGSINASNYQQIVQEMYNIPKKIEQALQSNDIVKEIAQKFQDSRNFLYLGRGYNFPVALEGALKLKEISYIHAEGYPAAEMKHGPIALIDEEMPTVVIGTNKSIYDKVISNIREIKARKGVIIAVVPQGDTAITEIADYTIEVPSTHKVLDPLVNTIPLQLLAYHIALLRGCDVDKPRNLAKSVTVE